MNKTEAKIKTNGFKRRASLAHSFVFMGFFLSVNPSIADAISRCGDFLKTDLQHVSMKSAEIDGTEGLIGYLALLMDRQIIGDVELLRFVQGLKDGVILNPIREEDSWVHIGVTYHREAIQEYINDTQLSISELLEWSLGNLAETLRVKGLRMETSEETKFTHQRMTLHSVGPGTFQMGGFKLGLTERRWGAHATALVHLTNSMEVMSTPVTQWQWVQLMGENPSNFSDGEDSILVSVKGSDGVSRSVRLQPDHPVENVTWWSVLVFANRLSEKQGLPPAYEINGPWREGTRPEDGSLVVLGDGVRVNINSRGYRLPTEAEQEYLLSAAGSEEELYFDGAHLKDHAWFKGNSEGQTHPVAELKPLVIGGQEFYDFFGNVAEWGWDYMWPELTGGDNPEGSKIGTLRVIRGSSWDDPPFEFSSILRPYAGPSDRSSKVGFRLVRTLR